ncbi:succinate dehydrogenase cytochrome b subunit [Luteococcus japonicus]|uniref:Succinate dehydrogenase cytochrome b subunit n=1 Tax=Luteococcus japonicus LSP_Lj1 TaxID=1255658 RepID=A0A1R4KP69_9ACTN|nr:succinate dehydrogenase cytochrome b subunit [Luteococcus japonicus]SJN45893.1 Succinate dehydrogenase cytochrome b subunit [Luteococcus japonicus LSP_Lj1]
MSQSPSTRAAGHPAGLSNAAAKVVMALTGIIFGLFVLVHMIGNLKLYMGPADFNGYAHWLRAAFHPVLPHESLLWILRIVLLACLAAHLYCGWLVRSRGRIARGSVRRKGMPASTWMARSMPLTGVILLGFLVFHLLDLTIGTTPVASDAFQGPTVDASFAYTNVVASFSRWPVALVYGLTMLALCAHLAHGLVSVVLDLGATPGPKAVRTVSAVALAIGLLVALGNLTIPVAVLTGVVK